MNSTKDVTQTLVWLESSDYLTEEQVRHKTAEVMRWLLTRIENLEEKVENDQ